ncbi:Xyloglucan endotransglucosylase/hydrolase protein 2, partial [Linum grandiflorum]
MRTNYAIVPATATTCLLVVLFLGCRNNVVVNGGETPFDENYGVTWGYDHVSQINQGTEVQLSMDRSSGAGFASKVSYGSGFFRLRMKLPDRNSAGIVTAFYVSIYFFRYFILTHNLYHGFKPNRTKIQKRTLVIVSVKYVVHCLVYGQLGKS